MIHVKICGVTRPEDATACVALGASAIGVNFVPSSARRIDVTAARAIARAVSVASRGLGGAKVGVVGIVADMALEEMRALLRAAELDALQLHGDEQAETLAALLPHAHAYKAVRIGNAADVARAAAYPGEVLLVDARVEGALGGTGTSFDLRLVADLARERRLILAGGLRPENVEHAVRTLGPYGVDVASGVESEPGIKDLAKVGAFIEAARRPYA